MKISNSASKSAEQIFSEIERRFPGARLCKPWGGMPIIMVDHQGFRFLLRYKKDHLRLDFLPPVRWLATGVLTGFMVCTAVMSIFYRQLTINISGIVPVIAGFLLIRALFKFTRRETFEQFQSEINVLINTRSLNIVQS
ncbi:hypothetical protein [Chitinophaga qingshengii]|uniref:Uncharacterized protein n=1 Tax=Chitinophaga qingshengii TaxID=1569794 RepID=A0ABR7TSC7_9BACT|nr:hypothetical protein [Chitinophaga qingshengii]MBC9932925.1 hypothetical protein [Chitinophaga qingshengii]